MKLWFLVLLLNQISFLAFPQQLNEEQIIDVLDSLHQKLLNYNYYDSLNNEASFFSFDRDVDQWAQEANEAGFEEAYNKAVHLRFLYFKYNGLRHRGTDLLDSLIARAQEKGNLKYVARYIYLKGTESSRYDDPDSALYYFDKANALADSIGHPRVKAAAVNAMAVTYARLMQTRNALKYYHKARLLAKQARDTSNLMMILGNIGLSHAKMENGDSALYYGQLEYDMALEKGNVNNQRQALNVIVVGSYLKEQYQQAVDYTQQMYDLVAHTGDMGYLITPYLYRSKSYYALGNKRKARQDAELSLQYARDVGYLEGEMNAMEWQVELLKGAGRYKQALEKFERFMLMKDSIREVETNDKIARVTANYEIRERENRIASLEQVNDADARKIYFRNIAIGALVTVFVVLIGLIILISRRRLEKQKYTVQETRNRLLRSQLNPHFLFNALSSIQLFLINKGQGKEALEYLSKFAKLMRRILENSRESFVALENEVTTLRHYLDLQKIRFDNKFDYNIQLDTENDLTDIMIPPMFAQPFIENSLEHGIAHRDDGFINIWFAEKDGTINFRVEDNGIGISRSARLEKAKSHQSLATVITNDRINLLRKQLKRHVSFNIREKKDSQEQVTGTEVYFELPIVYKYS